MAIHEYISKHAIGAISYAGYGFDHPYELRHGKWTFQIWQGERKHAEIVFDAVDAAVSPSPDSISHCFQMSKL